MREKRSIFKKLDEPPSWVFFIVPIILIVIPMIYPIGIPFGATDYTLKAYGAMKDLPPGSVVVMEHISQPMHWDMLGPSMIAVNRFLASRGIKVIHYCLEPTGTAVPMLKSVIDADLAKFGAKYGEDYVIFGLVAGGEVGMASFASDMWKTFPVDYYGNPIERLPLMRNIKSAKDVKLVIVDIAYCTQIDWTVRQWGQNYGVPIVCITSWGCVPSVLPYYPRQVVGILADVEGGAEFERLVGILGTGTSYVDAKSIGGFIIFAVFILANVVHLGLKFTKEGVKGG
jgi:hypothetical protein